jgi:hypothetical protein
MTEIEFSAELIRFIHSTVPTYESAVLIVVISGDHGKSWSIEEVVAKMSTTITLDAARRYCEHFVSVGVLRKREEDTFDYAPVSDDVKKALVELTDAYNRRPVTLIRVIASMPIAKIQAFADSFRFKREA